MKLHIIKNFPPEIQTTAMDGMMQHSRTYMTLMKANEKDSKQDIEYGSFSLISGQMLKCSISKFSQYGSEVKL